MISFGSDQTNLRPVPPLVDRHSVHGPNSVAETASGRRRCERSTGKGVANYSIVVGVLAMARRKRTSRSVQREGHPRLFRAGILVVHGVGNQKEGSTARLVARRIVAALSEVGEDATYTTMAVTDEGPRGYCVSMTGHRPVLVAECHWAEIIRETRGRGLLDVLRRLWLVVAVLPFLLAAVILPRAHEGAALDAIATTTATRTWALRETVASVRRLAPTMWRLVTLVGIILLAGVGLAQLTAEVLITVIVGACVLLWVLLRWRWDVIEHVRVASLGARALALIEERMVRDIDYVAERCDEVWIIGHSQGGYLAHRILAQRGRGRWPTVKKFTGLASGLRPIRLIASVQDHRWAWTGWLVLTSMTIMLLAMVWGYEPGGVINTEGSRILSLALLLGMVQPLGIWGASPLSAAILENAWPSQWAMLPILALGVLVFASGVIVSRRVRRESTPIPAIPSRIIWEELTSPSDIVGSMSVPEIPTTALCRTIPSLRQPIGDHLMASYLSRRSTFRMEMARWVSRTTSATPKFRNLDAVTEDLAQLSERSYQVRLAVQGAGILVFVMLPVAIFGRSLARAATNFVAWGVAVAVGVAVITAFWWWIGARRRMVRFVRGAGSAEHYRPHKWIRRPTWSVIASGLCAVVAVLGAFGAHAYAGLLGGENMSEASRLSVSMFDSGGSLMVAAMITMVAVWLAIARVAGVRRTLMVAMVFPIDAMKTLSAAGDAWLQFGAPGVAVPLMTGAGLLIAILGSRVLAAPTSTSR